MNRLFSNHDPTPWSICFSTVYGRGKSVFAALVFVFTAASAVPAPASEFRISLAEALDLARENAYEVKAAQHDSLAAEHGLRVSKTAWFPSVGISANAYSFFPLDPLNFGTIQLGTSWQKVYSNNLRLSYPIFTGGRRINDIRRNRENLRAAGSDLSASRLANVYRCRQAYIGLLIADRVVRATEASLTRVEIFRRDVNNLFSEGMADSVDVLETQLSVRQVSRLLENTRTQRRNASAALARLLGVPVDAVIVPTEAVPPPRLDPGMRVPEQGAVSHRPELSALDHRILAANYQRSIVKANLVPNINGMGGYAIAKPDVGDLGSDWQDAWWIGLTLSWDLNVGGAEISQSKQALEKVRTLEMQRNDLESTLILQTQIAWNNLEEAYNVFLIRGEEFELAKQRFRLAGEKRKFGQMTVNRFLELEAELTEIEQQFETARLRFFAALTDYLYAIGSDSLWRGL